jgi:hypothetical protein
MATGRRFGLRSKCLEIPQSAGRDDEVPLALDRKIPRAFQTCQEADIQDLPDSPAAESSYEELETLTVLSEPEDKK